MRCVSLSEIKSDAKTARKEFAKQLFIDAAKSIILREGIFNVTARKIAEITGYSYATIYHYFSDLNELFLETKLQMIQDMIACCKENTIIASDPLQNLKSQNRVFVDYFMENPNIFEFFYSYKMDDRNETAMKSLEIEKEYWDDYLPFVEKGAIRQSDIPIISRTITYAVFGMIMLYLSGNGLSKEILYTDLDNMVDLLLKGR